MSVQPADLVQDLGQLRLHPGALAGGQYDDVDITQANPVMFSQLSHVWLFDQFIALNDVVDLLRGQAQALADLPGHLPF